MPLLCGGMESKMKNVSTVKRMLALVLVLVLVIGIIQVAGLDMNNITVVPSQSDTSTTSPPAIEVTSPENDITSPPAIEIAPPEDDIISPPAIEVILPEDDVTSPPAITVSPPAIDITSGPSVTPLPLLGNLVATIFGQGTTTTFGSGSRLELGVRSSHTSGQVVTIFEQFNASTPDQGVIALRLEHGIGLWDAEGRATGAPGGNTLTWGFNVGAIESSVLQSQVTGVRWIQDPPIIQSTGNTYQPLSGTLIYTFAANTSGVTLQPMVRSDWAFSMSGRNPEAAGGMGRIHENAISVTTFTSIPGLTGSNLNTLSEDAVLDLLESTSPLSSSTLAEYALIDAPQLRIHTTAAGGYLSTYRFTPVVPQGGEWRRPMILATNFGGAVNEPVLIETAQFTMRYHIDMNVQGVRPTPGSLMTNSMISYVIVPDPAAPTTHVLMHVTFTQPVIGRLDAGAFEVWGVARVDSTPATHEAFPLFNNTNAITGNSIVTPVAGAGSPPAEGNRAGGAWQSIRAVQISQTDIIIAEATTNRLSVTNFPDANTARPAVVGDGVIIPLGRFGLRNEFADDLTNQAMRILFDCPSIGVTAAHLPAGSDGIINLHAWTNTGRMITDFSGSLTNITGDGDINNTGNIAVNFASVLDPGEYIIEIYYELAGVITPGRIWGWPLVSNPSPIWSPTFPFQYMGVVRDPDATRLPTRVIVGEFDPIIANLRADTRIRLNPPDTAPDDPQRIRDTAQFAPQLPADDITRFYYHINTSVGQFTGGLTLTGSPAFSPFSVTIERGRYFHRAPSAVTGHYVYLRVPYHQMQIDRNSISATWGSYTFSETNGNLSITHLPLTQAAPGYRVYRLALPDVTLGYWDEDWSAFPSLEVNFSIRALPHAGVATIPARDVIGIVPMNPELTVALPTSLRSSVGSSDNFTDHRIGSTTAIAGPSIGINFNISVPAELVVWLEGQVVDGGVPVGSFQNYNWTTGTYILNLIPVDGHAQLRINYRNNRPGPSSFIALVPIPEVNAIFPDINLSPQLDETDLQRDPFGFTVNLLNAVTTTHPDLTITYSTNFTTDKDCTSFVAWTGSTDPSTIRTVRIERTDLAPSEQGYVILDLGVPTGLGGDVNLSYLGQLNRYAVMFYATEFIGDGIEPRNMYRATEPVAFRMWHRVTFLYNYTGSSEPFHYIDVVHGGTITQPADPTRTNFNFLGWTTDAAGTTPFDFDTIITSTFNLYAQWEEYNIIIVEKYLTGDMADPNTIYTFHIYFYSYDEGAYTPLPAGTIFEITSTRIQNGNQITLDAYGRAIFTLQHSDTIVIEGVMVGTHVRIVEQLTVYELTYVYTVTIDLNGVAIGSNGNTGRIAVRYAPDMHFTNNNKSELPLPMGVNINNTGIVAIFVGLAAVMSTAIFAAVMRRKKLV